jgi:hypothetical protein
MDVEFRLRQSKLFSAFSAKTSASPLRLIAERLD